MGENGLALSIPTQTAVEGLRDAGKSLPCRTAMRHEILEIGSVGFSN
jgi:hypothetical protein